MTDNKNTNQTVLDPSAALTETEKPKLKRIQIPKRINSPTPTEAMQQRYAGLHHHLQRLSERIEQNPDDSETRQRLHHVLRQMLEQDAFLDYQSQSEQMYRVKTGTGLRVNVPKERAVMQSYSPIAPPTLRSSVRMFRLALLGLLFAGVPTFFVTPLIMWRLLVALLAQPLTPTEKIQATTLMFSSFILFCVACVLSVLLVLHLTT